MLTSESVDKEQLPQRGTAWQTAGACLGIWTPSSTCLVAVLRDHGAAEFAAPIIAAYDALPKKGPVHLFFDAETLTNYDSCLRTELTARFLPDRKRIASFHVLVKSRLVSMGVSVANLALGGVVNITADRKHFKSKLDAFLFEHRVTGFSSNALDVLTRPEIATTQASLVPIGSRDLR